MSRKPLLAVVIALAACAPADPAVTALEQDIIGGTSDAGEDLALILLLLRDAQGRHVASCSGSMITRRVLMTAAHCADSDLFTYEAWFADAYNADTKEFTGRVDSTRRVATKIWVHPEWSGSDRIDAGHDIALMLLDKPMPESVAPMPWNRERLGRDYLGMPVRMAGFGDRENMSTSPDYIKMTATNTMSDINSLDFKVRGATRIICSGDSGGPAFLTVDGHEVVAGITSYGDVDCHVLGAFTRLDLYLDDIDAFIAENDPQPATHCGPDGECGYACGAVDDDCPCANDSACTTACATPDQDPDCPLSCLAQGICVREGCAVKDPDCGDKPTGESCVTNNECATGLCAVNGDDKLCTVSCGVGATCPGGYACKSVGNVCLPESGGCTIAPVTTAAGARAGGWWIGLAVGLAALMRSRRRARS